jgi:hypothetical protein
MNGWFVTLFDITDQKLIHAYTFIHRKDRHLRPYLLIQPESIPEMMRFLNLQNVPENNQEPLQFNINGRGNTLSPSFNFDIYLEADGQMTMYFDDKHITANTALYILGKQVGEVEHLYRVKVWGQVYV